METQTGPSIYLALKNQNIKLQVLTMFSGLSKAEIHDETFNKGSDKYPNFHSASSCRAFTPACMTVTLNCKKDIHTQQSVTETTTATA